MKKVEIFFSERLRLLRKDKTQAEIASEIGVLQPTYAQWELGHRQPKLQDLASIAFHYGVTTDWLLGLNEENFSMQKKQTLSQKVNVLRQNAKDVSESVGELLASANKIMEAL